MQVRYRRPDGSSRVGDLHNSSASALRSYIASEEGVEVETVHLQWRGRPLSDDDQLVGGVETTECLDIETTYALCGGIKGKKKKKQHSTPKHVPHKRKKVKLAVLKYYSIDGDEVVRTRMYCANKSCGRGVMMAAHHDRCHCGKCGLTLLKKNN